MSRSNLCWLVMVLACSCATPSPADEKPNGGDVLFNNVRLTAEIRGTMEVEEDIVRVRVNQGQGCTFSYQDVWTLDFGKNQALKASAVKLNGKAVVLTGEPERPLAAPQMVPVAKSMRLEVHVQTIAAAPAMPTGGNAVTEDCVRLAVEIRGTMEVEKDRIRVIANQGGGCMMVCNDYWILDFGKDHTLKASAVKLDGKIVVLTGEPERPLAAPHMVYLHQLGGGFGASKLPEPPRLVVRVKTIGSLRTQGKDEKADEKAEKVAVEKVVRTYLSYQGTPGKHADMLELCVKSATHSVYSVDEDKWDQKSLPKMVKWWKENVAVETVHVIDSVRVAAYGEDSDLAVAFVDFHTPDVKVSDVFTLMRVNAKWKVVSVVQRNQSTK